MLKLILFETNFDDIYLEDIKNKFYIQVKNLKTFNIKTANQNNHKIKGQKDIKFIENETNINIYLTLNVILKYWE